MRKMHGKCAKLPGSRAGLHAFMTEVSTKEEELLFWLLYNKYTKRGSTNWLLMATTWNFRARLQQERGDFSINLKDEKLLKKHHSKEVVSLARAIEHRSAGLADPAVAQVVAAAAGQGVPLFVSIPTQPTAIAFLTSPAVQAATAQAGAAQAAAVKAGAAQAAAVKVAAAQAGAAQAAAVQAGAAQAAAVQAGAAQAAAAKVAAAQAGAAQAAAEQAAAVQVAAVQAPAVQAEATQAAAVQAAATQAAAIQAAAVHAAAAAAVQAGTAIPSTSTASAPPSAPALPWPLAYTFAPVNSFPIFSTSATSLQGVNIAQYFAASPQQTQRQTAVAAAASLGAAAGSGQSGCIRAEAGVGTSGAQPPITHTLAAAVPAAAGLARAHASSGASVAAPAAGIAGAQPSDGRRAAAAGVAGPNSAGVGTAVTAAAEVGPAAEGVATAAAAGAGGAGGKKRKAHTVLGDGRKKSQCTTCATLYQHEVDCNAPKEEHHASCWKWIPEGPRRKAYKQQLKGR